MMSHFVVVPIQSGWQTKTKFFLWFEDIQKIYHWILEWGNLVVCTSSNLDITLFFFKELDKTKYGQISVILLLVLCPEVVNSWQVKVDWKAPVKLSEGPKQELFSSAGWSCTLICSLLVSTFEGNCAQIRNSYLALHL